VKKFILIFVLFSCTAFAQTNLKESLVLCKTQSDSLKRLTCYDNVVEALSDNKAKLKEKPAKKAEIANANNPKPIQPENQLAEKKFGQEEKYRTDEVDQVRFVIKSATLSLRKKWKFEFENGQRWEQKDSDKFAKFVAGDEVLIKRGVMNAFYLKKIGSKRNIRVKRIK